jgi:glucose/arabinose dehydrogenase
MLIFENDASMVQVALADLESIEFEAPEQESRYPFGELDVDEVVVNNLTNPWSIDFIDNENLIFTELDGRLYTYNIPNADLQQIDGLPNITAIGQGGLIDVTLHPDFENNLRVYLVYSIGADWQFTTAVGYGTLNGNSLENFVEIFQGFPLTGEAVHFGSRIIFDNDGKLYFAIGDRGEQDQAQDKSNHYGSVLRINDDGTVPSDNPFLDDN